MAAEDTQALVPVREETVDFYGDALLAAQVADGTVYVPLRPICEHLGLDWSAQTRRVKRDRLLGRVVRGVAITATPGGKQAMTALPLKYLPGWLFRVSVDRVKVELQTKIERYQAEVYEVLWNTFRAEILPDVAPATTLTGAELAVEHARAILRLAEQQLEMERRLDQIGNKQEVMAGYLRGFIRTTQDRLQALELRVGEDATISDAQATEIGQAVKLVAGALAAREGGNQYGRVFNTLYARFAVSTYKNLRVEQYEPCRAWLKSWFDELQ